MTRGKTKPAAGSRTEAEERGSQGTLVAPSGDAGSSPADPPGASTTTPSSGGGRGARQPTKARLVQEMLARPEGATLAALTQATAWQAHTVRAALTRLRQTGHAVERSRSEAGETVYKIVELQKEAASDAGEGAAS
jgi:hypothetical protein